MVDAAGSASLFAAAPEAAPRPRSVEEAAGQFEALLIAQLLRSMHESGGWLGTRDGGAESLTELAEQQLSLVLASQGGLGLARLVADGLHRAETGRDDVRSQSVPK